MTDGSAGGVLGLPPREKISKQKKENDLCQFSTIKRNRFLCCKRPRPAMCWACMRESIFCTCITAKGLNGMLRCSIGCRPMASTDFLQPMLRRANTAPTYCRWSFPAMAAQITAPRLFMPNMRTAVRLPSWFIRGIISKAEKNRFAACRQPMQKMSRRQKP